MPATTVVIHRPPAEVVPAVGDVPLPGSTPAADATAVAAGACEDEGPAGPVGEALAAAPGKGDVAGGRWVGFGVGEGVGLGGGGGVALSTVGGFVRK